MPVCQGQSIYSLVSGLVSRPEKEKERERETTVSSQSSHQIDDFFHRLSVNVGSKCFCASSWAVEALFTQSVCLDGNCLAW